MLIGSFLRCRREAQWGYAASKEAAPRSGVRVAAGRAGSWHCAAVAARGLRDQEAEREPCGVLGSPLRAARPAAC